MIQPEAPPEGFRLGRWVKLRLYLAGTVLGMLFALVVYRATVLQVHEADKLKSMAEDQYLRDVEMPAKRGRIFDRHGVELAASAEVDSVYLNGRAIVASNRVAETAHALAETLRLDRRQVEKKIRAQRYFTWVKRRITAEEARAVRELHLAYVQLQKEPRRYYPSSALAGPLLGWAGLESKGQEGIELAYDKWLRGTPAQVPGLRDALGRAVLVGGLGDVSGVAGNDLHTTLDRYLQFRTEKSLEAAITSHRAKAGVAVVLDPNTGEILAMASVPSLNPNDPDGASERGARNRAVTDPFEPGSTMKTFTLSGALEAGVVRPEEHWWCENGKYSLGPVTIHDTHPIGDATTVDVLARSSNVCTAKIAARLGRERLRDTLVRFGFGRVTGVDLPGERAGQVRATDKMGPVETATMSFGQGMTATPLQVAAGYAAIAALGEWRRPHVMRRVVDLNGTTVQEAQLETRRVLSEKTAATMQNMLRAVTQKGGSAQTMSLPGYSFAGKTGTAQKVDPVTRHYSPDKWASSFVGFAPIVSPRLVIFVMVDEPQDTHFGSMVAGPVFQEVMSDALRYLGVPPDLAPVAQAEEGSKSRVSDARKEPVESEARPDEPEDEDGERDSYVASSDDPRDGTRSEVPDFSGMSVGEVLDAARRAGLQVEVMGSGVATAQSPGPGQSRRGAGCRVVFTPPG